MPDQAGLSRAGAPRRFASGSAGARRCPLPRDQHGARGARSPRPRDARGRRRRYRAEGTALSWPTQPNDLWCADYKGEFMLANRRYCYPLTITDFATPLPDRLRRALDDAGDLRLHGLRAGVSRTSACRGRMRTDNGVPFASPNALYGLSRLSVWWLRLGITHRADSAWPSRAERPPRAHAPDAQAGSHQACGGQCAAAAGALRCLLRPLQPRAAAPSAGHEGARRALHAVTAPVPRAADARLSLPRLDGHRHQLRPDLLTSGGR